VSRKINWNKNWVWVKGKNTRPDRHVYFRGRFEVKPGVRQVLVHLSADSRYLFYLDGCYQGRGPAKCDPKYQYYDTYDVTGKVKTGGHLVAALVNHLGEETFSYTLGRGGFLCQIEVCYRDGRCETYGTDERWKVKESQAWSRSAQKTTVQMGFQEIFDGRKEPAGWQLPSFDESGWERPLLLGKPPVLPWKTLTARDILFLKEKKQWPLRVVESGEIAEKGDWDNRKIAELLENELHLSSPGQASGKFRNVLDGGDRFAETSVPECGLYLIVDFGREVTGFPFVVLETEEEGGIIDLAYDELLIENRPQPRRAGNGSAHYADRYFTRRGKAAYQNSFTWRGFRYLELVLRNFRKPVRLHSLGLVSYHYPVTRSGSFRSSDSLMNRIWDVGRETLYLCMHDSYEDCPWREQAQWWGDGRVQALVNYYVFGDRRLIRKGLRQIAETQERRKDGLMLPFGPGGGRSSPCKVIPAFCLIWVLSLKEYYLFTGDRECLKNWYPYLTRLMSGFSNFLTARHLLKFGPDHWNFIDWAPLDYQGETTALNCYYVAALRAAAEISELNGALDRKEEYLRQAAAVKNAVNRFLWDEKRGLYADSIIGNKLSRIYSQHSNSLAVLFDVAGEADKVLKTTLTDRELVPVASPYFMFYFLGALFRRGEHRLAYEIMRRRWGEMVSKGAATFWEVFEEVVNKKQGWSLCHAWSSVPNYYLFSEYLSVKPLEPGFKKVLIAPKSAGVSRMDGVIPTPHGRISVYWQAEPKFSIKVNLPKGITATLRLPGRKPFDLSGSHEIEG